MATITITTTTAQDTRIAAAVGRHLRLATPEGAPRNATPAEIKALLANSLTGIVRNYEYALAQSSVAEPTPLTPT